jgi:ubiquinone/menaquinone biosynthesis C-methylase UbiE
MEAWYRDLIATPHEAGLLLAKEYGPYAATLRELRGNLLDIGGGAGFVRDYLASNTYYIVIDPSAYWLNPIWRNVVHVFPSADKRPVFIRGVGEHLPFPPGVFDAVLALWTLNHAADPARVLAEMYRVLKPHGRSILILEDMAPSWGDLLQFTMLRLLRRTGRNVIDRFPSGIKRAAWHKLSRRPWPLQSDHIRITEIELKGWIADRFRVADRSWRGGYLSFELRRN